VRFGQKKSLRITAAEPVAAALVMTGAFAAYAALQITRLSQKLCIHQLIVSTTARDITAAIHLMDQTMKDAFLAESPEELAAAASHGLQRMKSVCRLRLTASRHVFWRTGGMLLPPGRRLLTGCRSATRCLGEQARSGSRTYCTVAAAVRTAR